MPPDYDTLMAVQVVDDIDRLPVRDIPPLAHIYPGPPPYSVSFCGLSKDRDPSYLGARARDYPNRRYCAECRRLSRDLP